MEKRWRPPYKKLDPESYIFDFYMYAKVSDTSKEIFRMYYIEKGYTFSQIAKLYGFSMENARRLAKQCYWKTRRLLLDAGIIDRDNKEFDEKKASILLKELKNKESL